MPHTTCGNAVAFNSLNVGALFRLPKPHHDHMVRYQVTNRVAVTADGTDTVIGFKLSAKLVKWPRHQQFLPTWLEIVAIFTGTDETLGYTVRPDFDDATQMLAAATGVTLQETIHLGLNTRCIKILPQRTKKRRHSR